MSEYIVKLIIDASDQREAEKTGEAIADHAEAILLAVTREES